MESKELNIGRKNIVFSSGYVVHSNHDEGSLERLLVTCAVLLFLLLLAGKL